MFIEWSIIDQRCDRVYIIHSISIKIVYAFGGYKSSLYIWSIKINKNFNPSALVCQLILWNA